VKGLKNKCFHPDRRLNPNTDRSHRYMNVDYAFCQASLYNTEGLLGVVGLYDVACQWIIHLSKRIEKGDYLDMPEFEEGIKALVGKFHISAHVKGCFEEFSPNFFKGIGQVDGEILETLWSRFNPSSRMVRTASKAHRREILDDHMRDSNWKKQVGMGKFISCQTLIIPSLISSL
jgi:hypothetical protein